MWDDDTRYAVIRGKDARYDGQFVTAVRTTGIYCRPSCPARTPARANVSFYPTAAAAQHAGFRSCRRCFPDDAPSSPRWKVGEDVASRAMRLIDDGVVEREGVAGLARRLGYTERHVSRVLTDELGASPQALAIAHRLHHARTLLETTALPVGEVAFAAGFGSVRQFNDAARAAWALTPTEVRARAAAAPSQPTGSTRLELRLRHRAPAQVGRTLAFLGARAVEGAEAWDGVAYTRTMRLPHGSGTVTLAPADGHVRAALELADVRDLGAAVARCRRLLDLDADPLAVDEALAVVLDALEPAARVAFVLHDVFAVPFDQIAELLGRSVVATRQLASRARAAVRARRDEPAGASSPRAVVDAFLAAAREGDLPRLVGALAPDVVCRADAAASAMGSPTLDGSEEVSGFFDGAAKAALPATIDGAPGAVWLHRGDLRVAFEFTVVDGRIAAIDLIADPEVLAAAAITRGSPGTPRR